MILFYHYCHNEILNKSSLVRMINVYADGFFGKNEDYSEDLNRIEIDIIKAIQEAVMSEN
jgi:hypothetical protein